MIDQLVNNPHELSYHEKEMLADKMVQMVSGKGLNYQQAWWILDSHKQVFEEAIYHLNHNAAMEMKDQVVKYALNGKS